MKSVFDGYEATVVSYGGEVYFVGANTGAGFRSSYGEIAAEERLERLYIIKGSSGSGKSTLISRLAVDAESAGHKVSRYLCGSDPSSLDSVVLDDRIALVDGTPPHSVEMICPGAKSELVDLSRFLDSRGLERASDEIVRHTKRKRDAYSAAYKYLTAAERVEDGIISLARGLFDIEKARAFADRLTHKLIPKKMHGGMILHRYSHAVTMRGLYRSEGQRTGWQTYMVRDSMRCAPLLLGILAEAFVNAGCDVTLSHLPISDHVAAIELPLLKIAIVTHEALGEAGVINTARFVREEAKASVRGEIRLGAVVETSCVEAAVSCLSKAAEHHFALEKIYSSAMDFYGVREVSEALCRDIMQRLG